MSPSVRISLALLAVLSASCSDRSATSDPAPGADVPNVAQVRCRSDGPAVVLTPTVQAQPDGVHVEVSTPPGVADVFVVRSFGSRNAEDGPFVFPVPPGRMEVGCVAATQDAGDDSLYRAIDIVDENGFYVEAALDCDRRGAGSEGPVPLDGGDPIEAARSGLNGLGNADELVRVGYVARLSPATIAVRRDGRFVALLILMPAAGGWGRIGFEACVDAGIST